MRLLNVSRLLWLFRWTTLLAVLMAPPLMRATEWHATVGAQSDDLARQALAFLPNEIWIHEGDSITWNFVVDEVHTITFLTSGQVRPGALAGCPGFTSNPAIFDGSACVSTPRSVKGATFTVNFPATGNFKLVCLIHANMTGVVHVLASSADLPHDQDFYDAAAAAEARDLLADSDSAHHHEGNEEDSGSHVTAGNGEVAATPGGPQTLSVMRFFKPTITIHAGETVEWDNPDPVTPHTITFGMEPPPPVTPQTPPSANVTKDPDGARHATINSVSDSVHSGAIGAAPQDRTGLAQAALSVTRFRVTFTNPGIYPYICAFHDDLGMKGQVIVLP